MIYRLIYAFVALVVAAVCLWLGAEVTSDAMLLKIWRVFVVVALVITLLALCGLFPGFMPIERVR